MADFKQCPKCQRLCEFTLTPELTHHGRIRCPEHGVIWFSKPDHLKKQRRKVNSDLFQALPQDRQRYCWTCLRDRDLLRSLRPAVALQVHHVIEVAQGGTDDPANLQLLCAECHAEVHRRREAFNRYENKIAEAA